MPPSRLGRVSAVRFNLAFATDQPSQPQGCDCDEIRPASTQRRPQPELEQRAGKAILQAQEEASGFMPVAAPHHSCKINKGMLSHVGCELLCHLLIANFRTHKSTLRAVLRRITLKDKEWFCGMLEVRL